MAYLHIDNLYKDRRILLFRECFALEKVHGTSAHVSWKVDNSAPKGRLTFFSGGENYQNFVRFFDTDALTQAFTRFGHPEVAVFGEAYGGRCQGMKATYGDALRFVAFDVKVGDAWLHVLDAEEIAVGLGLEFVPYVKLPTDIERLDEERDRPSEIAIRRGCGADKAREGVVLRSPIEVRTNNGERILAKHKAEAFSETTRPRKVRSPESAEKLAVLEAADAIAEEWATEMRLAHVLDKMPDATDVSDTARVVAAMWEDVRREAKGEIVESREARTAVGRRTATMFKARLASR